LSRLRTEPLYSKARDDFDNILSKIPAIGKRFSKALRRAKGTIKYIVMPNVIFEELGFKYIGPINGHDIMELTKVLSRAKQMRGPVFVHVITQKGKGYEYAEKKPQEFHGISPFEIETGELKNNNGPSYSEIFGQKLLELAKIDNTITATTAAMRLGTGLEPFSKEFPRRFFDVGIAEGHAVTFSAGLAKSGMKPVVAIYSSFLQRAYDQLLHDVAMQNLHVVLAIDRAGIVGEDGETHQGLYDLSFLSHIPNMSIMAPASFNELEHMLEFAVLKHEGPIAIRYPRGAGPAKISIEEPVVYGKGVLIKEGRDITIAAVGNMVESAISASEKLAKVGISAEILNLRFIKPLDEVLILKSVMKTGKLVTLEDNVVIGGLGSNINDLFDRHSLKPDILKLGCPDKPITHGSRQELFKKFGLDPESIMSAIMNMIGNT
jgi:1-deoxy-D-xylulose-5-phosphate synthase